MSTAGLSRRTFMQAAGAALFAVHPSPRRRRRRLRTISWSGHSWTVRPARWRRLAGPEHVVRQERGGRRRDPASRDQPELARLDVRGDPVPQIIRIRPLRVRRQLGSLAVGPLGRPRPVHLRRPDSQPPQRDRHRGRQVGTSARPGRRPVRRAASRNARRRQADQASAASSLHDVVGMDAGQHRLGDHRRDRRVCEHMVQTHQLRAGGGARAISTSGLPKDMRPLSRWRSRSPASATPPCDAMFGYRRATATACPPRTGGDGPPATRHRRPRRPDSPLTTSPARTSRASATLVRCEIEMLRGFDCVQRIPSRSQYSQNSPRMSADRFEKNHRGYAYSAIRPLGSSVVKRLTVRQPSECSSPRRNSRGNRSTISRCQPASSILRSCLRPGPCCGKASGHLLLEPTTRTQRWTACGLRPTRRTSSVSIIAVAQSSMMSGYAASQTTTSWKLAPVDDTQPSPRYIPSR